MHALPRADAVRHVAAHAHRCRRIEAVERAGIALDLDFPAARRRCQPVARLGRRPVVVFADQDQQIDSGFVAAPQLGAAARIERDREYRPDRCRRDVARPQVRRREHRAAAVRPAEHADPLRVDLAARREPGDRRERVRPAADRRDPARAEGLGADPGFAARPERVDDQHAPAVRVQQRAVFAHAPVETTRALVGAAAAVEQRDRGRRLLSIGREPVGRQLHRHAGGTIRAGKRHPLLGCTPAARQVRAPRNAAQHRRRGRARFGCRRAIAMHVHVPVAQRVAWNVPSTRTEGDQGAPRRCRCDGQLRCAPPSVGARVISACRRPPGAPRPNAGPSLPTARAHLGVHIAGRADTRHRARR